MNIVHKLIQRSAALDPECIVVPLQEALWRADIFGDEALQAARKVSLLYTIGPDAGWFVISVKMRKQVGLLSKQRLER